MFWVGCVIRNPIGGGSVREDRGQGHGEFEMLLSLNDFVQHELFDLICISWDEESEAVTCGNFFYLGCRSVWEFLASFHET